MVAGIKKWYPWQTKLVEHKGNTTTRGGRQTGKSWAIAERIKHWALKTPNGTSLILAASERQENYLLFKVKTLFGEKYRWKARPTLSCLILPNGHIIYKYPIGQTGVYVEGLSSVYFIYIDEAIHVAERVYDSIIPMLAEPRKRGYGWLNLLSATRGKAKGTFFEAFSKPQYLKTIIKASECDHVSMEFLEEEKTRLGERMYGIIYDGEFDEEGHKYFGKEQVMKCVKIKKFTTKDIRPEGRYYLGIDPARYGKSKAAFASAELVNNFVNLVGGEEYEKTSLLDLKRITEKLDNLFHYRKIFIDDGGFGAGLVDVLTDEKQFKRRVRWLNNKSASTEKLNKILKEDLYSNLTRLLDTEKIRIVDDPIIINGLLNVEFNEDDKIIGTDMSEAVTRACWGVKEKGLKPFVHRF